MSPIEALSELLVLPSSAASVPAWLRLATAHLQGFSTQPEVIRRTTNSSGMRAESRRWSQAGFLPLTPNSASPTAPRLFLGADSLLYVRHLDGKRFLRNDPGDQIVDEIYKYEVAESNSLEYLALVQARVVRHLLPLGYENWNLLPADRRIILAGFGGTWENAQRALDSVSAEEHLQTLQLFLGPKANPKLRQEVLDAGLEGRHRPGPEVLSWLLAQSDWNLNPSLVKMARNAVEDDPKRAWELIRHPNPQVRLRLADVFSGKADWLGWLVLESDDQVRARVAAAIEQSYTPATLVELLAQEKVSARKEAIGWALAHWNGDLQDDGDWQALNRALFMPIGKGNKKDIKERLAKYGKLSLKARLLG